MRNTVSVFLAMLWVAAFSFPVAAQQRVAESAEQRAQRLATAAGKADSVADLQVLVEANCGVQPWQMLLRPQGSRGVSVEQSPTMADWKRNCVREMVGYSKFDLLDRN